jgi:hypothetical protein
MLVMLEWASESSRPRAQDRESRGDKEGGQAAREARRDRNLGGDQNVPADSAKVENRAR